MIGALWYSGFKYGVYHVEAKQARLIEDYRKATDILAVELQRRQQLLKDENGNKVRTVYVEKDATGCTDTTVPTGVLDALRSSALGSESHTRLF